MDISELVKNENAVVVEVRNKLVPVLVALDKLANQEEVPVNFAKLALRELRAALELLNTIKP